MIPEYFAIIGPVIASFGGLYYLYCTIRGTVKPNKVTWFFWAAFPLIAFAAQLTQDVGLVMWASFAAGTPPLLILIASFQNPDAYWRIRQMDYLFAVVAVVSIILWQVTDQPNIAITFALLADLAVALPTMIKSYQFPETEDWRAYALGAVGFGLAFLAVNTWTYENYAFVAYLCLVNVLLTVLAARKSTIVPASVR